MIKAVIFDMDGVIVDSEIVYLKFVRDFIRQQGVYVELEDLYPIVGTSLQVTWQMMSDTLHGLMSPDEVQREYKIFTADFNVDFPSILREEIHDLLKHFTENGLKIALASSNNIDTIEDVLTTCSIRHYFDSIVSGDMFIESKPNPEIYHYSAECLGVAYNECVVIEDSTYGVQAGHRAGMTVIALIDDRFNADQSLADYRIENLLQAIPLIDSLT